MNNKLSRRQLITGGLAATAGVSGLGVAVAHNGLMPPDHRGFFGPGETMTYAAQRVLTSHSMAREFPRSEISQRPFANDTDAPTDEFKQLQAGGFADWRLTVDGMVARPTSLSLAQIKGMPSRSQVTHLACEEGWSYIAEWMGTPLSQILEAAGVHPEAKYVVYSSIQNGWRTSVDMADALHPQTLVAHGMNGGELPVSHGGPLRLRVPRQLGYKSIKFINHLTVVDHLNAYSHGRGYSWYAGI